MAIVEPLLHANRLITMTMATLLKTKMRLTAVMLLQQMKISMKKPNSKANIT